MQAEDYCWYFPLVLGQQSIGSLFIQTKLYHVVFYPLFFFFFSLKSSLLALFICTLIISLVFAVIPLCHHVILLSIAMALAGKAMGVIDTIANLQLVKLYQKDSAIFLQVTKMLMCLCVCVGAVKKLLSVNLGKKKGKSLFDIALLKKVRGVTENNGALMSILFSQTVTWFCVWIFMDFIGYSFVYCLIPFIGLIRRLNQVKRRVNV